MSLESPAREEAFHEFCQFIDAFEPHSSELREAFDYAYAAGVADQRGMDGPVIVALQELNESLRGTLDGWLDQVRSLQADVAATKNIVEAARQAGEELEEGDVVQALILLKDAFALKLEVMR